MKNIKTIINEILTESVNDIERFISSRSNKDVFLIKAHAIDGFKNKKQYSIIFEYVYNPKNKKHYLKTSENASPDTISNIGAKPKQFGFEYFFNGDDYEFKNEKEFVDLFLTSFLKNKPKDVEKFLAKNFIDQKNWEIPFKDWFETGYWKLVKIESKFLK